MRKESVELVIRQGRDARGNPVGTQAANVVITGCQIWPRASSELASGETGVAGENIAMPDNANARRVAFKDHVMIRDAEHAVDEPPQRYAGKKILVKTRRITT